MKNFQYQSKTSLPLPGLSRYPDLEAQAQKELQTSRQCCGGRQRILRKYSELARKREKVENEIRRIVPNSAARARGAK